MLNLTFPSPESVNQKPEFQRVCASPGGKLTSQRVKNLGDSETWKTVSRLVCPGTCVCLPSLDDNRGKQWQGHCSQGWPHTPAKARPPSFTPTPPFGSGLSAARSESVRSRSERRAMASVSEVLGEWEGGRNWGSWNCPCCKDYRVSTFKIIQEINVAYSELRTHTSQQTNSQSFVWNDAGGLLLFLRASARRRYRYSWCVLLLVKKEFFSSISHTISRATAQPSWFTPGSRNSNSNCHSFQH